MIQTDKNVAGYLREAFLNKRTAHAYLVVGDRQQIPQLLKQCALVCMCANHLPDDGCAVCKKVAEETHQDVMRFPQDFSNGRLTVADIEVLVDENSKRPIDNGETRVFLINAANSTTGIGAQIWQNKLLKTLEEPNDNNYIFIGVSDAESLLPTVRSRCQILKQTKVDAFEIAKNLQKNGFDRRFCEVAASVCSGSQETAESIISNPNVLHAFDVAEDVLVGMTSSKNALPFVSAIIGLKENAPWCLHFLTVLLRESIVYRLAEELCLLPSHKQTVEKICQNYTLQAAEVCIEKINAAKNRLDDGGNLSVVIDQMAATVLEVRFRCRM